MFTVVDNPTFTHDVTINTPVDGGYKEQKLNVTFRLIPDEDKDEDGAKSRQLGDDEVKDYLRRRIVRFNDLVDQTGNPLPYNDEIRERMLLRQDIRLGLTRGYTTAVMKAPAGN